MSVTRRAEAAGRRSPQLRFASPSIRSQADQTLADENLTESLRNPAELTWLLSDNQQSVRDVVDSQGNELDHLVYDAYGNVVSQSDATSAPRFGYTGMQSDAATGLNYDQARYYDAATGNFLSQDPKGFGAGDANLYRYVGNNPASGVDPSGMSAILDLPPIGSQDYSDSDFSDSGNASADPGAGSDFPTAGSDFGGGGGLSSGGGADFGGANGTVAATGGGDVDPGTPPEGSDWQGQRAGGGIDYYPTPMDPYEFFAKYAPNQGIQGERTAMLVLEYGALVNQAQQNIQNSEDEITKWLNDNVGTDPANFVEPGDMPDDMVARNTQAYNRLDSLVATFNQSGLCNEPLDGIMCALGGEGSLARLEGTGLGDAMAQANYAMGPLMPGAPSDSLFLGLTTFGAGSFLGGADVALAGIGGEAAENAAITTPYGVEAQSASAQAQAALADAQNGANLYRTGQLGTSMGAESQYWSLQNPLTPGYAGQMGMPGVTPDFIMGGTLNPGASVITNEAAGLGANAGGGIQTVTSPNGVGIDWFHMP